MKEEQAPEVHEKVAEYASVKLHEEEINKELEEWKKREWLIECESQLRPTLSLMAIVQEAKEKIRPVLDYWELNEFLL